MMEAAVDFNVRARRMSDGMGVYTDESMFAFLTGDDIGLKLSPEDMKAAMSDHGAELFRRSPESEPMKDYIKVPPLVLNDYEQFSNWVRKSASYVQGELCVPS
jgi:TfoX/Sxy family transcriptional regulator of competence genes